MDIKKIYLRRVLSRYLFDAKGCYNMKWLNLEFNSSCNLRCKWCTLDHKKKREVMSENILIKILDEIISDAKFSVERIDLHNAGETLLHPKLGELLRVIAQKKSRIRNNPTVHLLTNAAALNEKKSKEIIESGALDEIRFSVDGGTKLLYESIRRGAQWELVGDNINRFLSLNKGKIKTAIICIVPNEYEMTTEWMEEEFKQLFSKVNKLDFRRAHNWDGSKRLEIDRTADEKSEGRTCKFLLKNLVVLPTGEVTVCCADLNGRGIVGDVKDSSLKEVFFSTKRLEMINFFVGNKKSKINLCKNCAGYYE